MTPASRPPAEAPEARLRCLVADDEPATLELLTVALQYGGFAVTAARDGREAMEQLRASPPDLVLLDVMMPGADGRDIARAIRHDPQLEHIVVVLHSAADEEDVEWRAAGADAFVQKPFQLRQLIALLRDQLRRRETG